MELSVLGACGSWPAAGEATSGYLLAESGYVLPIDLGTGTFARLQQRVSAESVSSLVITHGHPDHFVDLYALFYFRQFHPEPLSPVDLFAPPGLLDAVTCYAPPERQAQFRSVFRAHDVTPGDQFEAGPFTCRAYQMHHDPATIGLRITSGDQHFAYSADTGPTPEVVSLARDADLFLCEATSPVADARAPNHLTGEDAGNYARAAQVRTLLLTHLWPTFDPGQAAGEAAGSFGGKIAVAHGGLRVDVGASD